MDLSSIGQPKILMALDAIRAFPTSYLINGLVLFAALVLAAVTIRPVLRLIRQYRHLRRSAADGRPAKQPTDQPGRSDDPDQRG